MNSRRFYGFLLLSLITVALSFGSVFAQEATEPATEATEEAATGGMVPGELVSCDSDLILNLYIAERYFDFSSFNSQMSADAMLDLDSYDKGQYAALFDELDSSSVELSDSTRSSVSEMMLMDDMAFELEMNTMGMSETNLSEGFIEESAECAALRASLRRFFSAVAMSNTGSSGDSAGTDSSSAGSGQEGVYVVTLSGAAEVPGPGDDDALGTATVYLRSASNEVCADLSVQNITFPATAAHIHQGAAGESGPPVVTLVTPSDAGVSNTCATVDAALMQEMVDNPQNFYINVHNAEFPDGAVRGQLPADGTSSTGSSGDTGSSDDSDDSDDTDSSTGDAQEGVYTISLSGTAEVPGPGDDDASGTATVYLRSASNEVCVDLTIQNITFPATAAHIHQGAAGESGPPVVTLVTPSDAGVSNTCATVDAALMQEMVDNPQNFYINIHNAEFPDGAARGQLE